MRFIPLEYVVINTPLAPAEARARLAAAVDPGASGAPRALRGTIGLAAFALRRATRYPRALIPEFRGRIEPRAHGALLTCMVSLEPPPVLALAVVALASFWLGAGTLADVLRGAQVQPLPLAPLCAVVVAWVVAVRAVGAEARRLRWLVGALLTPAGRAAPPRGRVT
jgi:hypothetical protein